MKVVRLIKMCLNESNIKVRTLWRRTGTQRYSSTHSWPRN